MTSGTINSDKVSFGVSLQHRSNSFYPKSRSIFRKSDTGARERTRTSTGRNAHYHLKVARLPIPPPAQKEHCYYQLNKYYLQVEYEKRARMSSLFLE